MKAKKRGMNRIVHNPKDEIIVSLDTYLSQYNT
jgi:hypothetical protein